MYILAGGRVPDRRLFLRCRAFSGRGACPVLVHEPVLLQKPLHPAHLWSFHSAGTRSNSKDRNLSLRSDVRDSTTAWIAAVVRSSVANHACRAPRIPVPCCAVCTVWFLWPVTFDLRRLQVQLLPSSPPPCMPRHTLMPVPRRVQGAHHSLPGPLLFNAQYLIRLQFPLGYNFMRIMRYYGTRSSRAPALHLPAFQKLMNDMNTVPVLGTSFNIYAPMVLVVLCMFTFFKVRGAA